MMPNRGSRLKIIFFLAIFLSLSNICFALRATQVLPSGLIRLDDGRNVSLAGIKLNEEAINVISIMLSGHEIGFEKESAPQYAPSVAGTEPGYIYLEAKEISFPFNPKSNPKESKWMLNKFLLTLGMASAETDKDFKHKEDFVKEETLARQKGEFIESGAMATRKSADNP